MATRKPGHRAKEKAPEGALITTDVPNSDGAQSAPPQSGLTIASTHVRQHPSRPPLVLPPDMGDEVVLAFSGGKDSLATACALREAGIKFRALFFDWLPGSHITSAIHTRYRDLVGEVQVLAHPCLAQRLNAGVWETRESRRAVAAARLAEYDYKGARSDKNHGLWCAIGVRAADSPSRRLAVGQSGGVHPRKREFWPIAHWKIADVRSILAEFKVELPEDYARMGRSFDGLGARYTAHLDAHDRKLMSAVFPLWRADCARRLYAQKQVDD